VSERGAPVPPSPGGSPGRYHCPSISARNDLLNGSGSRTELVSGSKTGYSLVTRATRSGRISF
jgi:hypothetical protein